MLHRHGFPQYNNKVEKLMVNDRKLINHIENMINNYVSYSYIETLGKQDCATDLNNDGSFGSISDSGREMLISLIINVTSYDESKMSISDYFIDGFESVFNDMPVSDDCLSMFISSMSSAAYEAVKFREENGIPENVILDIESYIPYTYFTVSIS